MTGTSKLQNAPKYSPSKETLPESSVKKANITSAPHPPTTSLQNILPTNPIDSPQEDSFTSSPQEDSILPQINEINSPSVTQPNLLHALDEAPSQNQNSRNLSSPTKQQHQRQQNKYLQNPMSIDPPPTNSTTEKLHLNVNVPNPSSKDPSKSEQEDLNPLEKTLLQENIDSPISPNINAIASSTPSLPSTHKINNTPPMPTRIHPEEATLPPNPQEDAIPTQSNTSEIPLTPSRTMPTPSKNEPRPSPMKTRLRSSTAPNDT